MLKIIAFALSFSFFCVNNAQSANLNYQIDMILFTHNNATFNPYNLPSFQNREGLSLKKNMGLTGAPYTVLPTASSDLQKEYYALRRNADYQVVGHYSWIQPTHSHKKISLPSNLLANWEIEGTVAIQQSNYYLLNAKLIFLAKDQGSSFIFEKHERLNGNIIYYLDHPQAGMIIKIHKLA